MVIDVYSGRSSRSFSLSFFFFNDTATTEIYTLSLHDALPILVATAGGALGLVIAWWGGALLVRMISTGDSPVPLDVRSEEHTSELQSLAYLVCRLLLEKKKIKICRLVSDSSITWHAPLVSVVI